MSLCEAVCLYSRTALILMRYLEVLNWPPYFNYFDLVIPGIHLNFLPRPPKKSLKQTCFWKIRRFFCIPLMNRKQIFGVFGLCVFGVCVCVYLVCVFDVCWVYARACVLKGRKDFAKKKNMKEPKQWRRLLWSNGKLYPPIQVNRALKAPCVQLRQSS